MGFPIDTKLQDMALGTALSATPSSAAPPGSAGDARQRETEPTQRELAFGSSSAPKTIPESTESMESSSRTLHEPVSKATSEISSQGRPEDPSSPPPRVRGDHHEDDDRSPFLRKASRWIAVAGGCGYVPFAPGTAGSAAGALFFLLVYGIGTGASWMPFVSYLPDRLRTDGLMSSPVGFAIFLTVLIGVLTLVGIWASAWAERDFCREGGSKDDGRIVIDEVVGQLIALAPIPLLLARSSSFLSIATAVVTGFVLFRLFDVWKPGAVRWAERRFDGGLGVMADDLVAGVYAAGVLTALVLFVTAEGFHLAERLAMGGALSMGGGLSIGGGLFMGGGLS